MKGEIIIVGNLTKDFIFWVDKLPEIDDVATIRKRKECFGGRGAIVAMILSSLGIKANLITVVPGINPELQSAFDERHCSFEGIEIDVKAKEYNQVLVTIGKEEQNCTSLYLAGDCDYKISDKQETLLNKASIIYFTSHNIDFSIEAFNKVKNTENKIVVNISSYMLESKNYLALLSTRSDLIIGNEIEYHYIKKKLKITNDDDIFKLFPKLSGLIVTLGADGVDYFSRSGDKIKLPAHPVNVVTPLGVGDAFISGILYGEIHNTPISKSLQYGLELAAISIESEESCPSRLQLNGFLAKHACL